MILKHKLFIGLFAVLFLFDSCQISKDSKGTKPLQTIAIGSCSQQTSPQNYWQVIGATNPELWIWLGDIVYCDTYDMDSMRRTYKEFKQNIDYQSFIKKTSVIGVWDDHDYGLNDGGKEYSKRQESKELLVDFLDIPPDSPIRQHEGVYGSYTYGTADQQVKVILLDCRYFRDSLTYANDGVNRYKPNSEADNGTILGEEQWAWLEKELTNSEAKIHLIGSGIQIIAEEQGFEKWANMPKERKRFFDLLEKTKPQNTVLMSGDRHIAEISKMDLPNLPYPLYEITASGLTHTWDKERIEPNRHRASKLHVSTNFVFFKIDWAKEQPQLKVEIRNMKNTILEELNINFTK